MEKLALLGGTPVRSRLLPYAHQTIDSGDIAAVGEALSSSLITQGPTLERFERALAGRARVKHAVGFSSGTAALHGACWASGLGPGDRAITTPLTFAATANAVVYQGARPVFADIDAATLDLDPDAVKRAGRGRVRAVLSVDFAGLPCDYDRLLPLAREKGWTVIADAAHSFGGAYGDRPVGALADMTTLSFHPAKLIRSGSRARPSSTCRRSRRTGGTAGTCSWRSFVSSACRPTGTRSSRPCAPRTSARPSITRSSTGTCSIASGSSTAPGCARWRKVSKNAW